ncbi:MAG: phosphatase PAP2 family protein [Coriobacteriia bacterium]|nr:phosphatase PAP2 family protein [Coriobacteriia bacterium]
MGIDSPFGQMMSTYFGNFDMACFAANAAIQNDVLTVIAKFFSACGNTLFWFICCVFALVLILFKRTRKAGFLIGCAVVITAIVSTYLLNPMFGRLRPYNALQGNAEYFSWYLSVGGIGESEYSFPSKHAAVMFAVATALFVYVRFELKKKRAWLLFVVAILVTWSRNYLMVHYATDLIAGAIFGILVGFLSLGIYNLIMKFVNKNLKQEQKWDLEIIFKKKFGHPINTQKAALLICVFIPLIITGICFFKDSMPQQKCEYNGRDYICCNKADKKVHIEGTDTDEYRCKLHEK